ncbi:hypothetical protein EV182_005559 [Spiromyces aspiralis]|uniref:Uncharacterized protein n=1 Tax=Spiromyces aspiralis TaxID=68401 RepID=A0ACC1H9X3_9FUNG|nr:hypothetical protein EV182_005559 [Spiromyces aspiralis]
MYHGKADDDNGDTPNLEASMSWLGDFLAILSAVIYGCYTTLLKLKIGDESRIDSALFFGVVGVANILLLWPLFPALNWFDIESFTLPSTRDLWCMILVNAFVGTFLSDYLWLQAILMTSPLVVTLGLSLMIPLSIAGDVIFKDTHLSSGYYAGAVMILLGFFGVNLANS